MTAVVIGAGAGGLVAALYLQRAGRAVTLLEAKQAVGGCAGAFEAGGFRFLSGATTLMGLEPEMPLQVVLDELGITFRPQQARSNLRLWHDGDSVVLGPQPKANEQGLRRRYGPGMARLFAQASELGPRAWRLVTKLRLPPRGVGDLLATAGSSEAWALTPWLAQSTERWATRAGLTSFEAKRALDELLLVSTQSVASQTPALFGALGLDYLQRPLAQPDGGLAALLEAMAQTFVARGGLLRLGTPASRVSRSPDGFVIESPSGPLRADELVLNLTHWDANRLVAPEVGAAFHHAIERHPDAWAACTLHVGVPDVFDADAPPYHLVVLPTSMASSGAHAVFVTLSRADDRTMAPAGHRSLTISCHTDTARWRSLDEHGHRHAKALVKEELWAGLTLAFPQLKSVTPLVCLPGTPRTWVGFTGRAEGRVGGLPFSYASLLQGYPTGLTPVPGLVRVGDTVFPGQSVPACAWGARRVVQSLAETRVTDKSSGN